MELYRIVVSFCIIFIKIKVFVEGQEKNTSIIQPSHVYICEGQSRFLECADKSKVIFVDFAYYGRTRRSICPQSDPNVRFQRCSSHTSFATLWRTCHGKESCILRADKRLFGTPCRLMDGYIYVRYRCETQENSMFGSCEPSSWGSWVNIDSPRGSGDFESFLNHKRKNLILCDKPTGMEVRLKNGDPYTSGKDVIKIGLEYGATCVNKQQDDKKCEDYKIRYCCVAEKPKPQCTRPKSPRNGKLLPESSLTFTPGARIRYSCNDGYGLVGIASPICLQTSTWSTTTPICVRNAFSIKSASQDQDTLTYCTTSGFPHYRSYDGRNFKFGGICSYVMTKTKINGQADSFYVEIENQYRKTNQFENVLRKITVGLFGHQVELGPGRKVLVDKTSVRLPYSKRDKFQIKIIGRFIGLSTTNSEINILYGEDGYFSIGLADKYKNNVKGLCGNYDGNPNNDFTVQNDLITMPNANSFGKHYLVTTEQTCNDNADFINKNCVLGSALLVHEDACNAISDRNGRYYSCASEETNYHFESCRYDMCVQNGSKMALDNAIAAYVETCHRKGVQVSQKRSLVIKECGPFSTYSYCGSRCPNTCSDPYASQKCSQSCVEGCVCNKNYVYSDFECVPLSKCGCDFEGKYYKNKEVFLSWSCTRKCECNDGSVSCGQHTCQQTQNCKKNDVGQEMCKADVAKTCRVSGAPHYTTYDGSGWYDFNGRCGYIMSETYTIPSSDPRWFVVNARSAARESNKQYLSLDWIQVILQSRTIDIKMYKNATVTVNDARVLEAKTDNFTISRSGRSVVVSTAYGVEVSFTGAVVHIKLDPEYKEKVRGLCGDYNNAADDFLVGRDNSKVRFTEKYQLGSCQSDQGPLYICPADELTKWNSNEYCGALEDSNGHFAECHSFVNPETFIEKCVLDVCLTNGDKKVLSRCFEEYVDVCKREGVDLCDWRSSTDIPKFQCPDHSRYDGCAPACQNSCFNPTAEAKCHNSTVEDCICDVGYILEGTNCIRKEDCGCSINGLYVSRGKTIVNSETKVVCACLELELSDCFCPPGYNLINGKCEDINECRKNICDSNADCLNTVGSYTCNCREGQVGDGIICKDITCEKPATPSNSQILPNNTEYLVGNSITYSCELGYTVMGFPIRVCKRDGTWANDAPWCKKQVSCQRPNFVENGRFFPERSIYRVNDVLSYTCNSRIQLKGNFRRVCLFNGEWSGKAPTCKVECVPPLGPRNGKLLSVEKLYTKDDVIEFQCNKGYHLSTESFRTCLGNGTWAGPEPVCIESTCSEPPIIDNGYYSPPEAKIWSVGSKVTYFCNEGFASPLWKVIESECLATRFWSIDPPGCKDIDECRTIVCEFDGNFTNIHDCLQPMHDCHKHADCFNMDGSFSCVCQLGFSGDGKQACLYSLPCPVPDSPKNGKIDAATTTSVQPSEIVIFSCNKGYRMNGNPVNTCAANGKWAKKMPTCEDVNECKNRPCHNEASCTNTEGNYTCLCKSGFAGDGYNTCEVCNNDACGCVKDGIAYSDGELFYNEECKRQCICESGVIRCASIACEEDKICVEERKGAFQCKGSSKCKLVRKMIKVPNCLDRYNRTQEYNAGGCSHATCSEQDDTCCGIALENEETLLCSGPGLRQYPLRVKKISRCECQSCSNSRTTLHARVFGIDKIGQERAFEFGEVWKGDEFLTNTNKDGTFSMFLKAGAQDFVLRFEDNQNEFVSLSKNLKFKKEGGSLISDVQLPMLDSKTKEGQSRTEWNINIGGVSIYAPSMSFYKLSRATYDGKIFYRVKHINEKGYEVATHPGKFHSEGKIILFYDVFYCMFRGSRDEALMLLNAEITLPLNVQPGQQIPNNLYLWEWSNGYENWNKKEKCNIDKNTVCKSDITEENNYLAIARDAKKLCYLKVRTYMTDAFDSSKQMDNLMVKGIYTKIDLWYSSSTEVTLNSNGVCLQLPCGEETFSAKILVFLNGNTTMTPDGSDKTSLFHRTYSVKLNHSDNSINFELDDIRNDAVEPLYQTLELCQTASMSDNHLRFYLKSRHVTEFNIVPVEDNAILTTWYNTPLNWWPQPLSFKTCYIKIGIRGQPVFVQARSLVGQRPDLHGSLYGIREDKSSGNRSITAACIEVKCSGSSLDTVDDVTLVDIEAKGTCNRTGVNQNIETLNQDVYLKQRHSARYRMYFPEETEERSHYGIYTYSSRDLFISKLTALRKCYSGNGGESNVMIPGEGVGIVFNCV